VTFRARDVGDRSSSFLSPSASGFSYRFYQVIFILFVAIMIATVIRPVVAWLYSRRVAPDIAGYFLVYLLLLALLIGFALLLYSGDCRAKVQR